MSGADIRQAFFQLPASEQAALLDDLIIGSCDATWEARVAPEMEARVDAVLSGEMLLCEEAEVFGEMRARLHP